MANEQPDRGQEADQGNAVGWPGAPLNRRATGQNVPATSAMGTTQGKEDEQTRHDDPIQVVETEATPSPSVQEEERQLQWIHRWCDVISVIS